MSANGLIVAAPRSGSGKTLVTLGLVAALTARGLAVAPAKTGPDYIDTAILARTAGRPALNLDPWAMRPARLAALAGSHAGDADLLLVEGVMGLFDGAADGTGSTGDLAATLGLPVILVVDAERQSQSIAPLVAGFAHWRDDVHVAGIIVNRCASTRHERMLRTALAQTGLPVLGVLPRRDSLILPERHLGLVLPGEVAGFAAVVAAAAEAVEEFVDINALLGLTKPIPPPHPAASQRPAPSRGEGDPLFPSPLEGEGGFAQAKPGEGVSRSPKWKRPSASLRLQSFAKAMRKQPAPAEAELWRLLRDRRFADAKFRRQVPIGSYIVDFFCASARLIVELDGGQHSADLQYDKRRDSWLEAQGYRVLRIWNGDLSHNRDGVLQAIWNAVNASPPHPGAARHPSPSRGEGKPRQPSPLEGEGGSRSEPGEGASHALLLPPLGQRIAIARDDAFAFIYPHWLEDWRRAGAELSFFSPLGGEAPAPDADAIFLPGGYPELHAGHLAAQHNLMAALTAARDRGALIYGECGGFMLLGETLTDAAGITHRMAGLLPVATRIDRPKRLLGYRRLTHDSPLPWPKALAGHEFHYSSARKTHGTSLFAATDALGEALPPMGLVAGRVMGSYAHVIDVP